MFTMERIAFHDQKKPVAKYSCKTAHHPTS